MKERWNYFEKMFEIAILMPNNRCLRIITNSKDLLNSLTFHHCWVAFSHHCQTSKGLESQWKNTTYFQALQDNVIVSWSNWNMPHLNLKSVTIAIEAKVSMDKVKQVRTTLFKAIKIAGRHQNAFWIQTLKQKAEEFLRGRVGEILRHLCLLMGLE